MRSFLRQYPWREFVFATFAGLAGEVILDAPRWASFYVTAVLLVFLIGRR